MRVFWTIFAAALILSGCATAPRAQTGMPVSKLLWEFRELKIHKVVYLDTNYYLPTRTEALAWFNTVPPREYCEESFDCDDFVLEAMVAARRHCSAVHPGLAPAVGLLIFHNGQSLHAVVVFRTADGRWELYDPILRRLIAWPSGEIYQVII